MDVREIETALESYNDEGWEFWEELGWGKEKSFDLEGIGRVEFVEQVGGEGEGDHYHLVLRIGDRFFKKEGYYASYDGATWDGDFKEVRPTQKTITVYE